MNSNILIPFKKIIALACVLLLVFLSLYVFLEPEILVAASDTKNVVVILNVEAGISLTTSGTTTMSTTLGVATHIAVGTTTLTVATNNPLGYTLTVTSSTSPAMKSSSDSVADYPQTTPNTWSVASGAANFGFSVLGTDIQGGTGTWGTGTYCNGTATSTVSTTLKYRGYSTGAITIAGRSSTTTPTGVTTTMCYAVQQNNTYIPAGVYTATLILTATTL